MFDSLKKYQRILLVLYEENKKGNPKLSSEQISALSLSKYDLPFTPKEIANTLNPLSGKKVVRTGQPVTYQIIRPGILEIESLQNIPAILPNSDSKLSPEVLAALGNSFSGEVRELSFAMKNQCPISASVLLRRILEKLLIRVFLKHVQKTELVSANGDYRSLSFLLDLAQSTKIYGGVILNTRNASNLDKMKFLGDTAAHNPSITPSIVDVQTHLAYYSVAVTEIAQHQ